MLNGIRVFKSGPGQVALAAGHTSNNMIANLPRVISLPVAWLLLESGNSLVIILWLGCGAEMMGYMIAILLVQRRLRIPLSQLSFLVFATLVFLLSASGLVVSPLDEGTPHITHQVLLLLNFALLFGTMRILLKSFWNADSSVRETSP